MTEDKIKHGYEINELAREDSWQMAQTVANELLKGFDTLDGIEPAVTIYGSARLSPDDKLYAETEEIAYRLGGKGFSIITGGGPGVMEAANKGALKAGVSSIGLNIDLPEEQAGNSYTTKSITFYYF
ncbi:MAG: TIGR00730 family Rossman fold protein, partial [Dehalococcoidia bacterium]|nr:TIGR00730 family Rossman fold protein [Dehalococcoidia bacterium]